MEYKKLVAAKEASKKYGIWALEWTDGGGWVSDVYRWGGVGAEKLCKAFELVINEAHEKLTKTPQPKLAALQVENVAIEPTTIAANSEPRATEQPAADAIVAGPEPASAEQATV